MLSHDKNLTLVDALNSVFTTTSERIGGAVSAAAITYPLWEQQIKPYSDLAALIAPILGCIYLSLQIGFKLLDRGKSEE
jgi:hypothetical protein